MMTITSYRKLLVMKTKSPSYRYFEKEERRSRRIRIASYVLVGLLAITTAVVVYYALTK